ncbi:MAG: excinuclease ABC subunit UvrA, partial [Actinomycetes bacterium]
HCPKCGEVIHRQTPQQIVDQVLELTAGTKFQVLAPVIRGRKGEYQDLFKELQTQGFSRARIDGQTYALTEVPVLKKQEKHNTDVVVDRLSVKAESRQRITDSVETALRLANGTVVLDFVDEPAKSKNKERVYSEHLACTNCEISFDQLEPRSFSFNSPFGACPECSGLGNHLEVDEDLVIPNKDLSISEGAIAPWSTHSADGYWAKILEAVAKDLKFSLDTPYKKLSEKNRHSLMYGYESNINVEYKNSYGRLRSYWTEFEGVIGNIQNRHEKSDSDAAREHLEGFMRQKPCKTCKGARLKPVSLAVKIGSKNIAEMSAMSIGEVTEFITSLKLGKREMAIAQRVLKEVIERLQFLLDVGLDYLSLDRAAGTLSGGEAQRIRLATQIGSGLVGVLYVLDEPSIGLHQRDNKKLIDTLIRLRNLGNTLIVVEHDEETIRAADWVVDIGPGAGEHGGYVVSSGTVKELENNKKSITGDYISGRKSVVVPKKRRPIDKERMIKVVEAQENNLKKVTVEFPLGVFVAVTGVSGSGKSTLVNDILYSTLARDLHQARVVPGQHKKVEGIKHLDKVVHVDQSPIGRTPRSNPATYTGVFDNVRKLFAETSEAKIRGYQPGRFIFNVKGGRCEPCSGDGTIQIEMNFLPDVYVPCEVCQGARYNRDTLEVHYKGKTVSDVLNMPIEQALVFFESVPAIARHLKTLVDVGLGYVRLGQSAPTLSGGEAQRVKLATELQRRSTGRTIYVLDEPTTGLHFEDVRKLLGVLERLVDSGNTVIVIEHNLDVIKNSDWVIDMGPEGGFRGGTVVAQGTPEQIAKASGSYTGKYLAQILKNSPSKAG